MPNIVLGYFMKWDVVYAIHMKGPHIGMLFLPNRVMPMPNMNYRLHTGMVAESISLMKSL